MFRRTMAIVAGAALVLAGALAVQPAAATEIPTGNAERECTAAGYDWGVKLDTGDPGTYVYDTIGPWEPDGLDVELTVTIHDDNTFSWSDADPPVDAVLVKAGTVYTILGGGVSGTGGPSNTNGISHITFCYDDVPNDPTEELTVTKTVNTTYDREHKWKLDKWVDPEHVWLYVPGEGASSATVDWTIDVTYDGYADTGHAVYGTVKVENTGDTAAAVDELVDTMTIGGVDGAVALDCGDIDLTGALVHILNPDEWFECTYWVDVDGEVTGSNMAAATTLAAGPSDPYESADVSITWGDPANEINETVDLSDVGDLGGAPDTSFTAPMGGSVTYSHSFDWSDYGNEDCGDHMYDNTATLTSSDSDLELTDTATVTVHVQCMVFQGETAWAANTTAGTLPYNKKGGNWATYVAYPKNAPVTKVYQVFAGQTTNVGTATITPIGGGMVTVTVNLTGDWEYADTVSNLKIQTYNTAPSGNPSPGLFTYKTTCTMDPCTSGPIPLANFYGIHVDVGQWIPDPNFP